MSRSGYNDDCEPWQLIRWRGAVASSLRGRRGQSFLKELLVALDALPEKKLIKNELIEQDGCVCTLGAIGKARGLDLSAIDPEDHETVAGKFDVAHAMACEIMWENDEGRYKETPEARWQRMRAWVAGQILTDIPPLSSSHEADHG